MIIDDLQNAQRYFGLHPKFKQAFDYIRRQPETPEPGKYPVDGDCIHASVSLKEGVKAADAKFEAHENYIDIQVCPVGTETIGWKPRHNCTQPRTDYDPVKDVTFYNDKPDMYFSLHAGQFAIFFPEDAHAPMIGEGPVKKLVVKVKL
jgi:YhcH/YjgK/YiaL family protein